MSGNIRTKKIGRLEAVNAVQPENLHTVDTALVAEDCQCSGYTMAAVAGALLLCLGIVVYALLLL